MTDSALRLTTRCAHWGYDDHRFWGHGVSSDLAGKVSFVGLTALAVLGRQLPDEYCGVLEDVAATLTLSDPRIWPLKLTRLVAAYGSTLSAAAAGLMILQDARIGPWPSVHAANDLIRLRCAIGDHRDAPDVVRSVVEQHLYERGVLCGFGTPFRDHDERLVAFRACIERRHRDHLDYWLTMDAVAHAMRQIKGIEANIGLAIAAACLDMGLLPDEIGPLSAALAQHMFWANAVEGAEQAPQVLRQLPLEAVTYVGRPRRRFVRQTTTSMVVPRDHSMLEAEPELLKAE